MKYLFVVLMLMLSFPVFAQGEEPVIPPLNHQFQINEPAPEARAVGARNTGFGMTLDVEGDLLAIGAPQELNFIESEAHYGAVYIYRNIADEWVQEHKIINPEAQSANPANFGVSVALYNSRLAIGAIGYGVYFYHQDVSGWQFDTIALDNDDYEFDRFGYKTAFKNGVLAVADGAMLGLGQVHIFRENTGVWEFETTFDGDPTHASDPFGSAIDLSDDGLTVAISEPEFYTASGSSPVGSVYVYQNVAPDTWTLEAMITEQGAFGLTSLDLSGVGSSLLLAVGETGMYFDQLSVPGNVYVYSRASGWDEAAQFTDNIGTPFGYFGTSVKLIDAENPAILISAVPGREDDGSIAPARFYVYDVGTQTELSEIISTGDTDFDDDGWTDSDGFGRALDLYGVGENLKIVVGAPGGFVGDAATYVYSYDPNPEELVNSGDFEANSRNLVLNAWTLKNAKLKCGRGVGQSCAIKFKSGLPSKITQSVDLSQFPLSPGDGLLFQMDAKVKGAAVIKAKLKVFYSDGFGVVVPLRVENTGGVYKRVMSAPAIFVANRPLDRIVVSIKHTAQGGAAFLDNVSLVRVAGSAAR